MHPCMETSETENISAQASLAGRAVVALQPGAMAEMQVSATAKSYSNLGSSDHGALYIPYLSFLHTTILSTGL